MSARHEQSRLRAVVDTAVDGVILIDAQRHHPDVQSRVRTSVRLRVVRSGRAQRQDADAGAAIQHEHDGYLDNYRDTGDRKIIGIGREVLGRKRNGATFPMDLSVGEATEDGEPIFVGIIRDLTERKAAEQALREARRAPAAPSSTPPSTASS